MYDHLPGGEILTKGLTDLANNVRSVEGLLVLVAAPRLSHSGIQIPLSEASSGLPEHELYQQLCIEHGPEAYRHYRSLLRRLVSLESALESQARVSQ